MSDQETCNRGPCLAFYWPYSRAETVEVVSSLNDWEFPGFKLERYSFGEFACFLGQQNHFDEITFKFVINGSHWEIDRSLPIIVDEFGNENNRWTPQEATDHHDACILHVQRQQTLSKVDMGELCRLALAAHGLYDQHCNELECIADKRIPDNGRFALPITSTLEEFILLRFQSVRRMPMLNGFEGNRKQNDGDDVWIAGFPADTSLHPYIIADLTLSNSEKERRMESECATMRFLKEYTTLPVPEVFSYDVRYPPAKALTWEQKAHEKRAGIINKVEWPFILMDKIGNLPSPNYWTHIGNPDELSPNVDDLTEMRQKLLEQLAKHQLELAQHPVAACGYLTLNLSCWQRPDKNARTAKSSFGIRPCFFDTCQPFTNSIVTAFPDRRARLKFPLAHSTNSLSSITARFNHLLFHNTKRLRAISDSEKGSERDHFFALKQLRSLVFEIFGTEYENGPFILQHANLFPQNIFLTADSDKNLKISGIIDWDSAASVPIQVAACPPRMCLGRLRIGNDDGETQAIEETAIFHSPIFPEGVLAKQRSEYYTYLEQAGNLPQARNGRSIALCRGSGQDKKRLSDVLRREMVLPVYILDEICSTSLQALTGRVAYLYLPLIYEMVKGHKWEKVKEAVLTKGAMRYVMEEWEEQGKSNGPEPQPEYLNQLIVLESGCLDQPAGSLTECLGSEPVRVESR